MQVIVLLALSAILANAADPGWKRFQQGNLEVVANTPDATATRVLRQLARFRNAFEIETGLSELSQASIRVFLFRGSSDFSPYRHSEHVTGFYQPGRDRDLILIHEKDDPVRIAFHEFTHLVLRRSGITLPKWVAEGLAEYYSTTIIDDRRITIGLPVPEHLKRIARPDPNDSVQFYADSWARLHRLATQQRFPEWLNLVTAGTDPDEATRQIFGRPPEGDLTKTRTLEIAPMDVSLESTAEVADPDTMLARLLIELGRWEQADARLRKMPEAIVLRAELAMAQGKNEEAKLLYERALARGKGNGEAYYDYASLLYDSKAPTVDVITLLQKSIDLQTDWFPSRFLLGTIYAKEQRFADAIPQLEAALAMHPHDKAVKLELENARRRGVQQQTPTVTIRYPEKLKVDTSEITGMFVQLDCLGNLARMVIQSNGQRQFLLVTDPSAVTIKGGGSTNLEFACGPATPRKVRVLYKPGEDHVRGTAGEVTQIEFQ